MTKKNNYKTIYYTPEMLIQLDGYYKLPKWIMDYDISCGSKVLYALLLDRFRLSLDNGWIDNENRVYMYFSSEDVQDLMDISRKTAYNYFKELVSEELIETKRQGAMKANIIYLKAVSYDVVMNSIRTQNARKEKVMGKIYTSLEGDNVMGKNYTSLCVNNTHHDGKNLPNNKNYLNKNDKNIYSYNNENINSNKQNKDYKEIYKSNNTAIIDEHGNSVVEKKKTSKGFDVSRFVNSHSVAIQKARIDEANYNDKYSSEIIKYVSDSCNCFGLKQINIINQFTDDEYGLVFSEASCLVDDEHPYYTSIHNKKAYLSSVISKCIANHN